MSAVWRSRSVIERAAVVNWSARATSRPRTSAACSTAHWTSTRGAPSSAVRAAWSARIDPLRGGPVLDKIYRPTGYRHAKLDRHGEVVVHEPVARDPATHVPFIPAALIAHRQWPGQEEAHGHQTAALAGEARPAALERWHSLAAETVFRRPSKLQLIRAAQAAGCLVLPHVILEPEALTVTRTWLRARPSGSWRATRMASPWAPSSTRTGRR